MRDPVMCLVDAAPEREVWTWIWRHDRLTLGGRGCDLRVSASDGRLGELVAATGDEVTLHRDSDTQRLRIGDAVTLGDRSWWLRPAQGPRPRATADEAAALTRLGRAWIAARGRCGAVGAVPADLAATLLSAHAISLEHASLWLRAGQAALGTEVWLRSATWAKDCPGRLTSVRYDVTAADRMDPFSQQVARSTAEIEAVVYDGEWRIEALMSPATAAMLASWLRR